MNIFFQIPDEKVKQKVVASSSKEEGNISFFFMVIKSTSSKVKWLKNIISFFVLCQSDELL